MLLFGLFLAIVVPLGVSVCVYFTRNRSKSVQENELPSSSALDHRNNKRTTRQMALPSLKNMKEDFYESTTCEYGEPEFTVKKQSDFRRASAAPSSVYTSPVPTHANISRDSSYELSTQTNETEHIYRGLFVESLELTASTRSDHVYADAD